MKKQLEKKANFKTKDGISNASPKNKSPRRETLGQIKYYNVTGIYVYNINKLENYAKKQDRLDRLELLRGSILAGNNGVIQEFSQIAHLLNQTKVITKKQLNDLLKKYILNK